MKKILILHFIILLNMVGCSPKTQPSSSNKLIFSYEKTSCMGPCPVYKFTLYQNGLAKFKGADNVEPIGSYNVELNGATNSEFIELIEMSNLSQYNKEYRGNMTDLPTTTIHYISNGVESTITDYANAPEKLNTFEKEIESLIEAINWK